jgi:hypothetical protein
MTVWFVGSLGFALAATLLTHEFTVAAPASAYAAGTGPALAADDALLDNDGQHRNPSTVLLAVPGPR